MVYWTTRGYSNKLCFLLKVFFCLLKFSAPVWMLLGKFALKFFPEGLKEGNY